MNLRQDYELGARRPRPIVPVVVKAEIKSLALQFGWGEPRHEALDGLLRELPVADISSEAVIQAYARIDHESRQVGMPRLDTRASNACTSVTS